MGDAEPCDLMGAAPVCDADASGLMAAAPIDDTDPGGSDDVFRREAPIVYLVGPQTSDVVIFSQRRPPEVRRPSLGSAFHPESFFDGPGARQGLPRPENSQKQSVVIVSGREGVWAQG